MTDEQPKALWLADMLEKGFRVDGPDSEAAAELRRLHALCDEMGESIESLLWLINRDAPQLSGKRIGYAETALAKWKESK